MPKPVIGQSAYRQKGDSVTKTDSGVRISMTKKILPVKKQHRLFEPTNFGSTSGTSN